MSSLLALPLLCLVLCACGDSATDPSRDLDDALVGSWRYSSTNSFDLFGERLHTFFSKLQLSAEEVEAAVDATIQETRENFNFYNPDEVLTFQAGGTWSSNVVGAGSWRVEGDRLFLTGAGATGLDITYLYSIDGENLTISLDRMKAVDILAQSQDLTDELLGLFTALFEPTDVFVYSLTRVG